MHRLLIALLAACGPAAPPPPSPAPSRIAAACDDPSGLHRLAFGPAHVFVLRPTGGALVEAGKGTLADALSAAVEGRRSVAVNAQFQTLKSDFRDTRGATLRGDAPLHPLPPDDPTLAAPADYATLEAVGAEPFVVRAYAGPPTPQVPGRLFAMGGLFPLRLRGQDVDHWFVDGQERGQPFVAQAQGKMLVATGHATGCIAIVAHADLPLTEVVASSFQAQAGELPPRTFSAWVDDLGHAGFSDVLALDSGISPHLVWADGAAATEAVRMADQAVPILRYGMRLDWGTSL